MNASSVIVDCTGELPASKHNVYVKERQHKLCLKDKNHHH